MAFFRFLIWTAASVVFGIFLGGADIGGKSPLQHLQRLWQQHATTPSLDDLRSGVQGVLQDAKGAAATAVKPVEHYTHEDREALNKIVAKRGPGEK